jgi:hypothetical protein
MVTTPRQTGAENTVLTAEEALAEFDGQARRLMGMSGEEFIQRWRAGEFDAIADTSGHRHIMRLILMIPGDDSAA